MLKVIKLLLTDTDIIVSSCGCASLTAEAGPIVTGGAPGGFNPVAALKALKQSQLNSSRLEIGELLRVRGTLKTSREQREIMASTYYEWERILNHLRAILHMPSKSVVLPRLKVFCVRDLRKRRLVLT